MNTILADPSATPINMASMSEELAKQKLALEKDVEMAEKDKLKALNQLKKKESEVEKTVRNQRELEEQMKKIEQKVIFPILEKFLKHRYPSQVIFGGVNLLEKDEEQLRLLEESNRELQERKTKQSDMKKKITEAEVTLDDINKKYTSLQLQITKQFPRSTP